MTPRTDVIIAGAGPAGLSAAINAAAEGLRTTVIDPGTIGGQSRWSSAIENVPGFPKGITGADYANRSYRQAKKFGVRFVEDRVDTFEREEGAIGVQLASSKVADSKTLIIASGLAPRELSVPGSDAFGVFPRGANPDDLARWEGKRIALVGAGNSAGQAAMAFAKHGAAVTLYAKSDIHRSMSDYLIKRLASLATIHEGAVEAIGKDGSALTIGSEAYDAIFAFIGAAPSHRFPLATDDRAFIVAPRFVTSIDGVYAVGDVRADNAKRIAVAVGEGAAVVPLIHKAIVGA